MTPVPSCPFRPLTRQTRSTSLNNEAAGLAATIQRNFEGLSA